jgi:transposase
MALSIDLRKRVIAAVDGGMRITDAAKTFQVGRRLIYTWLDLRKRTNSLSPKSGYQKGHSHKITDWDEFRKFIEKNSHRTVKGMIVEWTKANNNTVSESAMERWLKKIGYTSKKNFWIQRSQYRKT